MAELKLNNMANKTYKVKKEYLGQTLSYRTVGNNFVSIVLSDKIEQKELKALHSKGFSDIIEEKTETQAPKS